MSIRDFLPIPKTKPDLARMDFESVLTLLYAESRTQARWKRHRIMAFMCVPLSFGLHLMFRHNIVFALLPPVLYTLNLGLAYAVWPDRLRATVDAIARFGYLQAAGPLSEALDMSDSEVTETAIQALTRLLPRLKASDASLLNCHQRACLNEALRCNRDTNLTLAILTAWEQVGDSEAIEHVERLAAGLGRGGHDPRIVAAAQECLPFLLQSAGHQQNHTQLLRPVNGSMTPTVTLLRPAPPQASPIPPEQLLRPTDAP